MIPTWIMAGFWGFVAGSALLIGAIAGYFFNISQCMVASIMAFGAGVLMSAISFELMEESFELGGFSHMIAGFIIGAAVFTIINVYLTHKGGKHRKRSVRGSELEDGGTNSLAIAVGSVLDGIPESIAIGVTMIEGEIISLATVAAVFISNIPEGLSSSAGMRKAGWKIKPIFLLWVSIAISTGIASLAGYSIFSQFPSGVIAMTLALAAGAILAMIVDTMIPEAFSKTHNLAGLITVLGFMVSFILSKIG